MNRIDFYKDPRWVALRKKVKKAWLMAGKPCGYCNKPVHPGQRLIVDHIKNRVKFPELAFDPRNTQVVHWACNTRKYYATEVKEIPETGLDGFPVDSEWSD